jgi:hypothetical protein
MKKLMIAAIAAAAMVPMALPSQAAKCSRMAAEGTAVTNALATENAKMALATAISGKGLKAKGSPAVSCKYVGIVSTCTAKQAACK